MSKLSLKNDFKDGDVLHGDEINTNNDATVAAVNNNYEEILKLKDIKADVVNVDNQLKTKVDVGTFNDAINSLNDTKADKSVVNQKADKTELANKADLIYVNNELSKKADISYVNTQLTQKANLSDVNSKLSLKADKATTYTKDEVNTTIDNKIVSKADKTELNSKADKSSLGDLSQLLTSDKSSAVAAINETIREGVANNIDALSITKSNDNKIQTVGVIDSNAKGYATKTWTGTRNEYNSIQNKNANTLYYIIDDDDEHELVANKVKTIDENSNNTQYPSAKAVYDRIKEAAPDLSNYVQYDNYAVSNKGGVIKGNLNGFNVDSSGTPLANVYNKENYDSADESIFISKGTLENIKNDYVGTSEPINVLNDTLDNVIPKQTATDSIINVNDALKYKTFNFKVDGAYEQNGEPTPETPVPITTLNFNEIMNCSQNLFDFDDVKQLTNNEKITTNVDDDGFIHVDIDNTNYSVETFANYWTNISKNLKTNHDYLGIIEVKEYSGSGFNCFVGIESVTQFKTGITYWSQETGIFIKKITTKDSFTDTNTMLRSFIQCPANSKVSITYRISIIADLTVTPDTFTYQPYKETNYLIDLQGNEMVSLPNGVKDELQIDKEGNVNLIKKIGKKIINEADLNGINDAWFTLIDYLRLNKPNDYIGYNKVALSNSYNNNTLLNKFHRSPKETPRETYDDVYSIIEYQSTSNFALTIPKGTTLEQAREMAVGTVMYYELAEPQTISLGKLSDIITTEQGSNTFAINSNIDTQISATYALDLKKYIDNKISTVSQAVIEQE